MLRRHSISVDVGLNSRAQFRQGNQRLRVASLDNLLSSRSQESLHATQSDVMTSEGTTPASVSPKVSPRQTLDKGAVDQLESDRPVQAVLRWSRRTFMKKSKRGKAKKTKPELAKSQSSNGMENLRDILASCSRPRSPSLPAGILKQVEESPERTGKGAAARAMTTSETGSPGEQKNGVLPAVQSHRKHETSSQVNRMTRAAAEKEQRYATDRPERRARSRSHCPGWRISSRRRTSLGVSQELDHCKSTGDLVSTPDYSPCQQGTSQHSLARSEDQIAAQHATGTPSSPSSGKSLKAEEQCSEGRSKSQDSKLSLSSATSDKSLQSSALPLFSQHRTSRRGTHSITRKKHHPIVVTPSDEDSGDQDMLRSKKGRQRPRGRTFNTPYDQMDGERLVPIYVKFVSFMSLRIRRFII